ncbi:unnamed protein product [Fraxinus pennsylvanica]|uniref:Uncharacterized protein n=1 Tax=Fraxinus pennsylvanica TaxID=56036 RepID=A0AAD1ZHY8_9LAMI|nr:unnamed protein product [Fraxinus pennsylvanica]
MEESMKEKKQVESDCMRECMRKLSLWYTKTFNPLLTHDDLNPIMATLGFVPSLVSVPVHTTEIDHQFELHSTQPTFTAPWIEYLHCSSGLTSDFQPPRPRLPYSRIDGLHIYTYRAFLDALNFYLRMPNLSDLFHVRGLPLHQVHDRGKKWWCMGEDDSIFVYGEGTLDQAAYDSYCVEKNGINSSNSNKVCNSITIRNKGKSTHSSRMVPLKDIIVLSL